MQVDASSVQVYPSVGMYETKCASLPKEMVYEVLSRCSNDMDTFKHCSLVSKEWNSLNLDRKIDQINTRAARLYDILEVKSVGQIVNFCTLYGAKIHNFGFTREFSQARFYQLVNYLPNLSSLRFAGCTWFSDDHIGQLAKLTKLTHLDLSFSQITDASSLKLLDLEQVQILELSYCDMTCERFSFLPPQENILALNLSGSQVTDKGLASIASVFPNLCAIRLYDCPNITDEGVLQLSVLKNLSFVDYCCHEVDETMDDFLLSRRGHIDIFDQHKDLFYIKDLNRLFFPIRLNCCENTARNLYKVAEKALAPPVRLTFNGQLIDKDFKSLDQYGISAKSILMQV